MMEKCIPVHFHNDHFQLPAQQVTHELLVAVEDPISSPTRREIKVYGWVQVSEFRSLVAKVFGVEDAASSSLRLMHKNIQLSNERRTLVDYNLGSGSVIVVERRTKMQGNKGVINPYKIFDRQNRSVSRMIKKSVEALEGKIPTLTSEGTSGVYIIENLNMEKISIFKPFDEEVNAPNNPRGKPGLLGSDGICKGILSGECATREVAAYLLDTMGNNFHHVPATTYIEFYHPTFTHKQEIKETPIPSSQQITLALNKQTKHGSLQEFVTSDGLICDYGSKKLSEREIHKIAILDIRILNCDRNQENILVTTNSNGTLQLIPIDHGLSFPDNLEIYEDSVLWMGYPQTKRPFDPEQLKFIQQINPTSDSEMLESKLGFRKICLRNFRVASIFLKKAASLGFTLYEMGKMLYRIQDYDSDSDGSKDSKGKTRRSNIESIVMQAENLYLNALETMEKENIQLTENTMELNDQMLDSLQCDDADEQEESTMASSSTCGSIRSLLQLRKKSSLPQMQRKDTSFHESRNRARKQREGINGISKTIWKKYHNEQWNQLFYYYFENLLDTLLVQKMLKKGTKLQQKIESA